MEELVGSLKAYKQRRRKKHELHHQPLQAQLDLNETQNAQGQDPRGKGRGGQGQVAEDEVAEDEVDVIKIMLKTTPIIPGCRTGVVVVKKGTEEIGPSQKWNASGVASTTTT